MQIVEGIPDATGVQIDVMDNASLSKYISKVHLYLKHVFCAVVRAII